MAGRVSWFSWLMMRRDARRRGILDGSRPIPHWDDPDNSEYEWGLKQEGDNWVRTVAQEWSRADKRLVSSWQRAKTSLASAEKEKGTCETRLNDARSSYTDKHGCDPDHVAQPRPVLHWCFIVLLFIGELPLNAVALRLLALPEALTYVVTLGLAFSLVGGAYYLGVLLKDGHNNDRTRIVLTTGLLFLSMLGVVAISVLREMYIAQMAAGEPVNTSTERTITIAFVIINLLIFFVALVTAYSAHDPLLAAVVRSRERLGRAKRRIATFKAQFDRAKMARTKTYDRYHAWAHQQKDSIQKLISLYRVHNLEVRDVEAERSGSTTAPAPFKPLSFGKSGADIKMEPFDSPLDWPVEAGQSDTDPSVRQPSDIQEITQ